MSLSVRSVTGGTFRRAGLSFSDAPTIVSEEKLNTKLGPPSYRAGTTVRDVLMAEKKLACTPVEDKREAEPSKNGEAKKK